MNAFCSSGDSTAETLRETPKEFKALLTLRVRHGMIES
jgi:hypothetical protein